MIASIYFANEETSWENKQRITMYMCRTVGVDGMDWGQAGEKRKRLPPFVLYLVLENMAGVGEQSIVLERETQALAVV